LFFPLFVTAGITGIRDMGGPPTDFEAIDRLRRRIEAGHLVGPRIVASGPMIDGYPAMFPEMSIAVNNGEEARQAVDSLERKGADFIKVYSLLSRESYFAVADECRRRNLVFAGHVPDSVSVSEASAAGQKSIEHLTAIVLSCSKSEHELRQKLLTARASNDPKRVYDALTAIHTEGLAGYDQSKAHALFQTLARNRTWVAPTLVTARILFSRESLYAGDAEWKESKKLQRWAIDGLSTLRRGTDVSKLEYPPSLFRVVGEMHRAGVEVMAGTDTPNPLAMPGPSLHAELEFLLRCGFSPMEALQAATIKPAEFLGLDDRLGSIQAGKTADLVLLEADPLANIRNVERVFGVVLRGRLLLKSELNDLSASARKAISVHQSASRRLLNGQ
jgi:imidazolonepropionase-like amidohydrolase